MLTSDAELRAFREWFMQRTANLSRGVSPNVVTQELDRRLIGEVMEPPSQITEPPDLMRALIAALPPEGSTWPVEQRRAWFECAVAVLSLIYGRSDDGGGSITISVDARA